MKAEDRSKDRTVAFDVLRKEETEGGRDATYSSNEPVIISMYSNYGSNERTKHAFSFSGCLSRENSLPICEHVRERNTRDLVSKATGKGPVSYLCFRLIETGIEVEGVLCH